MASLAFDNPLDAALSADDDDAEAEAGQPRGWQPDSNIKFYDQHPRRNNVSATAPPSTVVRCALTRSCVAGCLAAEAGEEAKAAGGGAQAELHAKLRDR